jgi:hypothetical protein
VAYGQCTYAAVAEAFGLEHSSLEDII